jgi:hypothetical protein
VNYRSLWCLEEVTEIAFGEELPRECSAWVGSRRAVGMLDVPTLLELLYLTCQRGVSLRGTVRVVRRPRSEQAARDRGNNPNAMTERLGAVLQLMHEARTSYSSLRATVRTWSRTDLVNRAFDRWAEPQPEGSIARFEMPGHEEGGDDESGPGSEVEEFGARLWVEDATRWRVEYGDPPRARSVWATTAGPPTQTGISSRGAVESTRKTFSTRCSPTRRSGIPAC